MAGFMHLKGGQKNSGKEPEHLQKTLNSLAGRLKAGSVTAANELVDAYYEQIYLFMRRLGHSHEAGEDLTQESFIQAWRHIGQLRQGKALSGWLYRIAGNISKQYWRKHKGKAAVSIEEFELPDRNDINRDKAEQLECLKSAVAKLPMKFRQAVVLHYMQHLTIAEAARAAGLKEGTFKSRLNRALRALENILSE